MQWLYKLNSRESWNVRTRTVITCGYNQSLNAINGHFMDDRGWHNVNYPLYVAVKPIYLATITVNLNTHSNNSLLTARGRIAMSVLRDKCNVVTAHEQIESLLWYTLNEIKIKLTEFNFFHPTNTAKILFPFNFKTSYRCCFISSLYHGDHKLISISSLTRIIYYNEFRRNN